MSSVMQTTFAIFDYVLGTSGIINDTNEEKFRADKGSCKYSEPKLRFNPHIVNEYMI